MILARKASGVETRDLGLMDFDDAASLQRTLVEQRADGVIGDTLLLLEHPHIVTRGRGFNGRTLCDTPHPVVDVDRGGDVTYHGPGQIIGYPIVHLADRGLTIGQHLRLIEEALIVALRTFGLEGTRLKGFTGVWTGGRKIASIGIGVRRWVAYHGFALNVTTALSQFAGLYPCGLEPSQMTSVQAASGRLPDAGALRREVAGAFSSVYSDA